MSWAAGLLVIMTIPYIPVDIFSHFLPIVLSMQVVKPLPCPRCLANAVSWCCCIMCRRNSSSSSTYKLPLYLTCPSSCIHSAIVISCNPLFIRIASHILPGEGSVLYPFAIRSGIEGRNCTGGLSANKRNCSGRFCGFRTTCSIFPSLASPPSGRSPGLLVKASLAKCNLVTGSLQECLRGCGV